MNILFLTLILFYTASASPHIRRLNEYIEHYEPLVYDALELQRGHLRARRSSDAPADLKLSFKAYGRDFDLRLRRDFSTFSDDLQVVNSLDEPYDVSTEHIYHGELVDDPQSKVFGSVTEGVFEGKILADDGAYYVEHARRYFPPNGTRTKVHSVIYKESDVGDPYAHRRHVLPLAPCKPVCRIKRLMTHSTQYEERKALYYTPHLQRVTERDKKLKGSDASACGVNHDDLDWMNRIEESAEDENSGVPPFQTPPSHPYQDLRGDHPRHTALHNKSSKVEDTNQNLRSKRAIDKNSTCTLYIRTDPTLWWHVRRGFPDHKDESKRGEVDMKTRGEIVSLIAHHVAAVNYLYRDTKFDGRLAHRNIQFKVLRIKIDSEWTCHSHNIEPNPFCAANIEVSDYLKLHSQENYEDYCLAYAFTYRNFMDGILGKAWLANAATGAAGGICEKQKTYIETVGNEYHRVTLSLNTGIITLVNYNATVPAKISQLMFAHQIGHNFGSPHDYPVECRPGGKSGNFIMYAAATSGDRPNNSRFSMCSVGNISAVLDAVRDGRKRNCFIDNKDAFCGNKIVEEGEECDCGIDNVECTDRCCYPQQVGPYERERNSTATGCTRRADTQCSPSQGPCCNGNTCQLITTHNYTCRAATACSKATVCSTTSADCPAQQPEPNYTTCNNGTQVCINGECTGSICLAWGMKECFLSAHQQSVHDIVTELVDQRAFCQLACQITHDPNSCRSTADFANTVGLPAGGISLQPGSPCNNFQGYCDMNQNCRPVRPSTKYPAK